MLLTIFNLPAKTRYIDVKSLIHAKCGFKEVILDNLTSESNNTMRVTVGLAEEEDAAILVRKINGLFLDGHQLYVETIKKKAPSTVLNLASSLLQPMLQQPYYQQSKFQPNYESGYSNMQQSRAQQSSAVPSLAYRGTYGTAQNTSASYGYPQQMQYQSAQQQMMPQSMVGYDQGAPLGFSNQGNSPSVWSDQNDWNLAGNASGGNQVSQQSKSSSRWENTSDSSNRSRRDAPVRNSGQDRSSRFGQDVPSRDAERNAPRRDIGRDATSRDRGREPPRNQGRARDHGRERNEGRERDQRRERGRDAPARDHGREPLVRNAPFREPAARSASFREHGHDAPPREHGRDAPYNRKPEQSRAPTKRRLTPPPPTLYGEHVTHSSQHMRTFSQQQDKPNQTKVRPQPKQNNANTNYGPPLKRPKKQANVAQQCDKPQANVPSNNQAQPNPKKSKPDTPERILARAATWRHQIAAEVTKEVMKGLEQKIDVPLVMLVSGLKRAVRYRLDELFGDNNEIRMPEMLKIYKEKFPPDSDTDFYNKVRENILAMTSLTAGTGEKAVPVNKNTTPTPAVENKPPPQTSNTTTKISPKPQEVKKANKAVPFTKPASAPKPEVENKPPLQSGDTTLIIPSYPQGDKRANKGQKKTNAQIFEDEDILLSKMEPKLQKALNDEIDEIWAEIGNECEGESEDPQFQKFEKRIRTTVYNDCKKMMKVNLAKRMMNIGPIMLRIFSAPKTITRSKLAAAVATYGVTSLRKSERKKPAIYYATCENYDDHDRLCSMEPIVVDGSKVVIKPFQLTGKEKIKKGNQNSKNEDPMMEGVEEQDDEIDEDNKLNTDYDQSNTQEDDDGNGKNKDWEAGQPDQEFQETENADDEDTNGNIKLESNEEQGDIDNNNADSSNLPETVNVKSEIETETEFKNGNVKSEIDTETENKNGNVSKPEEDSNIATVDIAKNINDIPISTEPEDIDFTADIDISVENEPKHNSFKIDAEPEREPEKDISEMNAKDLEDYKGNNIDDIDIADLNDDDLEDW